MLYTKGCLDSKNGFVWLEAHRHDTSVESSGCGFDGKPNRPSVQTMPSVPGVRAFIPISHAHKFYIGKLTFDVVAKEHKDLPVASPDFPGQHYETEVGQSGDNQCSTRGIKVPDCELNGCDHNIKPELTRLEEYVLGDCTRMLLMIEANPRKSHAF